MLGHAALKSGLAINRRLDFLPDSTLFNRRALPFQSFLGTSKKLRGSVDRVEKITTISEPLNNSPPNDSTAI